MAIGNRRDNAQGRLYFVFEIGDEEINYSLGFVGMHQVAPML
jgi:hypothetical protein